MKKTITLLQISLLIFILSACQDSYQSTMPLDLNQSKVRHSDSNEKLLVISREENKVMVIGEVAIEERNSMYSSNYSASVNKALRATGIKFQAEIGGNNNHLTQLRATRVHQNTGDIIIINNHDKQAVMTEKKMVNAVENAQKYRKTPNNMFKRQSI